MDADILFWTKIAAIGQVAGAIATFIAVLIALVSTKTERSFRIRVSAKFQQIVDANGTTPVMTYEVENTGLRPVVVSGIHWTTGVINIFGLVPKTFRLKGAFQLPDYSWSINQSFPWRLDPGESRATHIRKSEFVEEFAQPRKDDLFRRFFWQRRPALFYHRVGAAVTTRRRVVLYRVDPSLTAALNKAYRG